MGRVAALLLSLAQVKVTAAVEVPEPLGRPQLACRRGGGDADVDEREARTVRSALRCCQATMNHHRELVTSDSTA